MSDKSGIEWTEATWNPTTGCDRVSSGCDHCYAMTLAKRLKGMGSAHYQTDGDPATSGPGFGVQAHPDALDVPIKWRRPRLIFVNSMSDLFHDAVPREFIADVFGVMAMCERHTFQILTKRHARMRALLNDPAFLELVMDRVLRDDVSARRRFREQRWPLRNVWLGVSVEDQHWADLRVPVLLATPAAVRFLSCEPLLGPVDLRLDRPFFDPHARSYEDEQRRGDLLHWCIVGGESGPGARPMHPQWARDLRDQCAKAGVPFFFKQWGAWAPTGAVGIGRGDSKTMYLQPAVDEHGCGVQVARVGKKAAGRELDGATHDGFPKVGAA